MNKQSEKREAIKHLQILRNIGPKMAEKLYTLGIKTPEQMRESDPEKLFERLQTIDAKVDPCELYAFRGAVLDIPWWDVKNLQGRELSVGNNQGRPADEKLKIINLPSNHFVTEVVG